MNKTIKPLEDKETALQARIKELEEALQKVHEYLAPRVEGKGVTGRTIILPMVTKALSTSPDQALQRVVLEARIDERIKSKEDARCLMRTEKSNLDWEQLTELHNDSDYHIQELCAQLAALELNTTKGEKK